VIELSKFEIVLSCLGLGIAGAAAWAAWSQERIARTNTMLASAQRKDALFDRRHETVMKVADSINLILNEEFGAVQEIDALKVRVQALFPSEVVEKLEDLRAAIETANEKLKPLAICKVLGTPGPGDAKLREFRGELNAEIPKLLAPYRAFLDEAKSHMNFDEPDGAAPPVPSKFGRLGDEIAKLSLSALLGAGLALGGQIWLQERQEGKALNGAACRLLPDMEIIDKGLALVAAKPLPALHDLPVPSEVQVAERAAEGLPPDTHRKVIVLRDAWQRLHIALIDATIEHKPGAEVRMATIAEEISQQARTLRADLERLCGA